MGDWAATVSGFGSRYGQAIFVRLNQPSNDRRAGSIAPVIRRPGRVAGHPPTSKVELKNHCMSTSILLCDFMARTEATLSIPHTHYVASVAVLSTARVAGCRGRRRLSMQYSCRARCGNKRNAVDITV